MSIDALKEQGVLAGMRAAALLGSALVAMCVILCIPCGYAAWAEGTSSENAINTQQTPDNSFLYDASIYDLANATQSMDNQTVQVSGEVVGDLINDQNDPDKKWITLSSLENGREGTIAVLIKADDARLIDTFGRYDTTGTTLRVKGTFHLVCYEDDGESDLHAETVTVTSVGRVHHQQSNIEDFLPGAVMLALGLACMLLFWLLNERRR